MLCLHCKSSEVGTVLVRETVPVYQNALYEDRVTAVDAPTGRLEIVTCKDCGATFNGAYDPSVISYDQGYENDQSNSSSFFAHMNAMADRVLSCLPSSSGVVVEVGCGQGTFLNMMNERAGPCDVQFYGFDPAFRSTGLSDRISIRQTLLSPSAFETSGNEIDALVTRHVIEHVSDPISFLSMIAETIQGNEKCKLFIETPCFDWIMRNNVVQDMFYEHVNYFTDKTLASAAVQSGLEVIDVEHVFDGQYLWLTARSGAGSELEKYVDRTVYDRALEYSASADQTLRHWRTLLRDCIPTAIWGGGAKGVTFSGLVDPNAETLKCIIDINPGKQGSHCAGTGLPIVSPSDAMALGVQRAIVMNPNYLREIRALIETLDFSLEILDVGAVQ